MSLELQRLSFSVQALELGELISYLLVLVSETLNFQLKILSLLLVLLLTLLRLHIL